jgi:hypothetical protein
MPNPNIETADGAELKAALALLDRFAGMTSFLRQWAGDAREAADGLRSIYCTGCGRMSEDCSADPCADVIEDRGEGNPYAERRAAREGGDAAALETAERRIFEMKNGADETEADESTLAAGRLSGRALVEAAEHGRALAGIEPGGPFVVEAGAMMIARPAYRSAEFNTRAEAEAHAEGPRCGRFYWTEVKALGTIQGVPADFPVKVIASEEAQQRAVDGECIATCEECGRAWDDDEPTSYTPAPSGRCPFEAFH